VEYTGVSYILSVQILSLLMLFGPAQLVRMSEDYNYVALIF